MAKRRPSSKNSKSPGTVNSKKVRKPESNSTNGRPRPAAKGDISPSITKAGIERHVVSESIEAAQQKKVNAVLDIVSSVPPHDPETLTKVLEAILEGTSSDDASVVRSALLMQPPESPQLGSPKPDDVLADNWRQGGYPYKNLMSRKNYERQKYQLQVELLKLQSWVRNTGQKVVILFEGRDAAGKGGTIKRFMEHLNPRGSRVVALEKPTDTERGQWYFQRYIEHLPTAGEIVMFDRSWY
ncbi:MAG: polyphosphate kinase 2, partial [Planctomycetaceae bacterium]|nr:polyphosphate kinase 2 [Planctomycetaceae bacterium]